jgi:hypothetical protein
MVDACLDLITVLEAQHRALAVTWALEDTIHRLETMQPSQAVTEALEILRARLG